MKRIIQKIIVLVFIGYANLIHSQIDLAIGNVNAGYSSYNQNTGVISGLYFDVLNNENDNSGEFRIAIFLIDPNNSSTYYEVGSIVDSDGQSGNTVVEYENITIDFNSTSGIPDGDYRLIVCVDEDEDVDETNEGNNCLYITTQGNNLSFTNSTATELLEMSVAAGNIQVFPNPAINFVEVNIGGENRGEYKIIDFSGRVCSYGNISNGKENIDVSNITKGVYLIQLDINGRSTSSKLIIE